jgi:multiple sugar transport system substrate-binding protein
MTRRTPWSRPAAVAAAALLLTALGAPAAEAQVTLKFWRVGVPDRDVYIQKLVDQWNAANPGVRIVHEPIPLAQYGDKLSTGFVTGTGPDVFWVSAGQFTKFVDSGIAHPLTRQFSDALRKDLEPVTLAAVTVGGEVYAVPMEMDPVGLIYDKKLFRETGTTPPRTWDELVAVARKLRTPQRWGIVVETDPGYFQNFLFYPWLWQAGGAVISDDWKTSQFGSPAAAQALGFWSDLVNKHKVAPPSSKLRDPVPNGLAAMQEIGMWVAGIYKKNYPTFELGVAPLPIPPGGKPVTVYGGWSTMVNARGKHVDDAVRFAFWLFGEDPARVLPWTTEIRSSIAARRSVRSRGAAFYEQQADWVKLIEGAQPEPRYPPEIVDAVSEAIQATLFRGTAPAEAAAAASAKIQGFLSGYTPKR